MSDQGVALAARHLSSVFIGGRIGGFFNRHEGEIREGELSEEAIKELQTLSPGFAEIVREHRLNISECKQGVQRAAELADEKLLSATHYQQTVSGLFERKANG